VVIDELLGNWPLYSGTIPYPGLSDTAD